MLRGASFAGGSRPPTRHSVSPARLDVRSPRDLEGVYRGLFSSFSVLPPPAGDFTLWAPPSPPHGDPEGCSPYIIPEGAASACPCGDAGTGIRCGVVAIVRRGNCTYVQKTLLAQRAGAEGVVVVNSEGASATSMGGNMTAAEEKELSIFALGVPRSFGDRVIARSGMTDGGACPVVMSVSVYEMNYFDLSELLVILLATSLVVAGAYFATSDMRQGSPLAAPREEVVELNYSEAVAFFALGSCMLVVLFFFMKYMIYFIILGFCLGGGSCIAQLTSALLRHGLPSTKRRAVTITRLGTLSQADLLASVPAAVAVGGWLYLRNTSAGWIFQDTIGAAFLCMIQRTLQLPNIKVATLFLCLMFCFDVFWVFFSPLIFHESVMVKVAKGGGTGQAVPMLLVIPAINDPLGSARMLGFGDVALPGLLISYLLRFDKLSGRKGWAGYFVPAVVGYFLGLWITMGALVIMKMAQPALLYLVPGTLGTTIFLAHCRGELLSVWNGNSGTRASGRLQFLGSGASQGALVAPAAGAAVELLESGEGGSHPIPDVGTEG